MDEPIETHSTSARTTECSPIVLREKDRVRLVFLPTLIENPDNPRSSVKGSFVYQRKGKNDEWMPLSTESLAALKKGEGYRLDLHSAELAALGDGLRSLYLLVREQGLPRGHQVFVRLEKSLARFLALGEREIR